MKNKIPIYTILALALVSSAILFVGQWCPWAVAMPSWLVFVGYALLSISVFLDPHPKDKMRIFWIASSVSFLRMMLFLFTDLFPVFWNNFRFIVDYVEAGLVLFAALACCSVALWRRLQRVA